MISSASNEDRFNMKEVINCKIEKEKITETIEKNDESSSIKKEGKIKKKGVTQADIIMAKQMLEKVECYSFYKYDLAEQISQLSPVKLMRSNVNQLTVLRGTQKKWSATRLLSGKHAEFDKINAQHLFLMSKCGDLIDSTYLSAADLAKTLEQYGGIRMTFKADISKEEVFPFPTKEVIIHVEGENIEAEEISEEYGEKIGEIESHFHEMGMFVIQDNETGKIYILKKDNFLAMQKCRDKGHGVLFDNLNVSDTGTGLDHDKFVQSLNESFPGYLFENNIAELEKLLKSLAFEKTPWKLHKVDGKAYLIPKDATNKIDFCMQLPQKLKNLKMKLSVDVDKDEIEKGATVILSMNQMEVYEQYISELLTFALEGTNVISYNNGGKGLSLGGADIENINAAIETCYQYIRQIKQVPDEKIIAKGQCFGGAPTSWLAKQHENINVIMDQSPDSFKKVVVAGIDQKEQDVKAPIVKNLFKFVKNKNKLLDYLMPFPSASENIKHNRGNVLIHIDIPTDSGSGGDNLVTEEHNIAFYNALTHGKKHFSVSYNPGGEHVTSWYTSPISYKIIKKFLVENGLTTNIYKTNLTEIESMKKYEHELKEMIVALDTLILKNEFALEKKVGTKDLNELLKKNSEIKIKFKCLIESPVLNLFINESKEKSMNLYIELISERIAKLELLGERIAKA